MVQPTPKPTPPISGNVIGRNTVTGPSTDIPTSKPTSTPNVAVQPNLSSKINNKLGSIPGMPVLIGTNTPAVAGAEVYTDAQLAKIGQVLKKLNYTVKSTAASVKTLLTNEPELSELMTRYPLYSDFITNLSAQYLPGLDTPPAPNYPTRQIYKYDDTSIANLVDSAYQSKFGRAATEEEKQAKIASIRKELEVGTLSTTKLTKNPKTGKMENVVTQQQQGLTTAEATAKLEKELQASNPEAYQRNKALQFATEIQSIMSRGI